MQNFDFERTRQRVAADVTAQLPAGTFNLSIDQAAPVIGNHPGHIRNQISQGIFPVATIVIGKRRLIPLTSLIDYLAGLVAAQQQPEKPKIGRPTKAEQRARRTEDRADAARLGLSIRELRAQTKIAGV